MFSRAGNLNDIVVACRDADVIQTFYYDYSGMDYPVSATNPTTQPDPTELAIGDFNDDRDIDVAVITENDNVDVFDQSGGVWGLPYILSTAMTPVDIVSYDFNNDFDMDIVVSCAKSNQLSRFQQTGGSLSWLDDVDTIWEPQGLCAGDFNRDNRDDLGVASYNNDTVAVHFQGDVLNFWEGDVEGAPEFAAAGDLKGDGTMDLVVTKPDDSGFSVLTPEFKLCQLTNRRDVRTDDDAGNPRGNAIGDLNNDSYNDTAVVNYGTSTVTIYYMGPGAHIYGKVNYLTGANPWDCAIGDVNNDGRDDLVVTAMNSNRIDIFYQNASGVLDPLVTYSTQSAPRGAWGNREVAAGVEVAPYHHCGSASFHRSPLYPTPCHMAVGHWSIAR